MLANPATGSVKNIAPKRLIATSNADSGNACTCASPVTNAAFGSPPLSCRASSTSDDDRSSHEDGLVDPRSFVDIGEPP